jgi:hypothetical protein
VLYTAKCFWPGVTETTLRSAASRAGATFRGALNLPSDELVLSLFESSSPALVKRASEDAGMPCERVIETVCAGSGGQSFHALDLAGVKRRQGARGLPPPRPL